MSAVLYVPTPLRKLTQGQARVQVQGSTLAQVFEQAESRYPGFQERVLEPDGEIKRFINVFINGVDVRKLQGKQTPVHEGDEVSVVPAMAGGQASERSEP